MPVLTRDEGQSASVRDFKTWEELTFADDFLFCLSMQDERICKPLIEILLETEISQVKYIHSQEAIATSPGRRGVRLDVRVKSDGRIINVELQNYYESDLPFRIRYYQAMGDSQLLQQGTDYERLPEYVTLFICTRDPFAAGLPAYHIEHRVREDPAIRYDDKRRIVVYNCRAWKKAEDSDIRAMLQYIDGHEPEDSERVREFADSIRRFKDNSKNMEEYMDWYIMRHDYERLGRDRGLAEAREEMQPIIDRLSSENANYASEVNRQAAEIAALKAQLAQYQRT